MDNKLIALLLIVTLTCCQQKQANNTTTVNSVDLQDTTQKDITSSLLSSKDTAFNYIYAFMREVIKDQKLDSTYSLEARPELNCSFSNGDDKTFLTSLMIKPKRKTVIDPNTISLSGFNDYFTQKDIDTMLRQKENLKNFSWNAGLLGFSTDNKKNWYTFSMPLFSKDRKTAILLIRDLCPGLCGRSYTVILKKKKGNWVSEPVTIYGYH